MAPANLLTQNDYGDNFDSVNAKKNLVFHFEGGRHASFPQKPVVNIY